MSNILEKPKEQKRLAPVIQILTGPHKGKQFRLFGSQIIIGRDSSCDVILKDNRYCSKRHARIRKQKDDYFIESLNPKNPLVVNKKPITTHLLQSKDKLLIGKIQMLFIIESSLPSVKPIDSSRLQKTSKRSGVTFPRLIIGGVCIFGIFLFLSDNTNEKNEQKKINIKTEATVLEEVASMEALNEEKSQNQKLLPKDKEARTAFIRGFRDYRKGYFHRALQVFQHCLILDKTNPLCLSYSQKSEIQISKLIQKKIRLGNTYKKNQQYEFCKATFKSVEIMIQDSKSLIYKEVVANKKSCENQLKNQI